MSLRSSAYTKILPATVSTAVLFCALAPTVGAGSKSKFDKRYRGTLSGSTTVNYDDGDVIEAVWSVSNLKLKLRKTRKEPGGWTAVYKVTSGSVSFSQIKKGACTHSVVDKFALLPALPNPPVSEPLALGRNSNGKWWMLGGISTDTRYSTTETCTYSDGSSPRAYSVEVMVPQLFDPMGAKGRPGKRIRGRYTDTDKAGSSTITIVRDWDLKPR